MEFQIKKATLLDIDKVYNCIKDAKELFKTKNSTQWQDLDGYPSKDTIIDDIKRNELFIACINSDVLGIVVLTYKQEDCYNNITNGKWITNDKYAVIHRLATAKNYYHNNIAYNLLNYLKEEVIKNKVYSIRVDTMENNIPMINLLNKCNYKYCGIIYLDRIDVIDKKRLAFELALK